MRYLTSISLALIVLMALACTAAPATPAPTPDVPLLDENTVKGLVTTHVFKLDYLLLGFSSCAEIHESNSKASDSDRRFTAEYIGNDIWVVVIASWSHTGYSSPCTFTVHDKRAHVILPQEGNTAD